MLTQERLPSNGGTQLQLTPKSRRFFEQVARILGSKINEE
jgi:hypothetical protein